MMKMECQRQNKSIFQSQSTQQNDTSKILLPLSSSSAFWSDFLSTFVAINEQSKQNKHKENDLFNPLTENCDQVSVGHKQNKADWK